MRCERTEKSVHHDKIFLTTKTIEVISAELTGRQEIKLWIKASFKADYIFDVFILLPRLQYRKTTGFI